MAAYVQKVTPPPNRVFNFSLKNFVGGLNNRSEQLEINEASDVLNMMFADDTIMETRYGTKYYDGFTLDSDLIYIDEFKPYVGTDQLVRATASKLYIDSTLITSIQGKPCGVNHSGRYYFADGYKLYVYGKFAQTTTTFTKVIGTPVDAFVLMEVVSPAEGHPRLGTSYTQGVLNVDYTNHKVYYEPCENEFVDPYNGANLVPTGVKYIVSHDGRMYMSGDDKDDDDVFITQVQNPFYFPASMPVQLPPNSDKIVGMHVFDDSVIISREKDLYAISGKTNNPELGFDVFQLRKINSHTGFATHESACTVHNYLFFLGSDGVFYSLASAKQEEKILATSVISQTLDLTKSPISLTLSDVKTACSLLYEDEWHVSIKDKVLVYSYQHRAWTMYNHVDALCFYKLGYDLIWGKSNGKTYTFDKINFLDNGEPYESHWFSKPFDMNDANSFKQFREFFVVAHAYDDYLSDVRVVFEVDYVDVKDNYTITNQISRWGISKWGDRFINRNIIESIPFIIGRRGRNIRFKLFNRWSLFTTVANFNDLEHVLGRYNGALGYVTSEGEYYLQNDGNWYKLDMAQKNQRMKIYQVNGDYEMRGKR